MIWFGMYLALGMGTAAAPRAFSSFRPGISDILFGFALLDVPNSVVVTIGSVTLRCGICVVWNDFDRVTRLAQLCEGITELIYQTTFVNCGRRLLQNL